MSQAFLAALQLSDSVLPIGRFVHSQGLEAWFRANPDASELDLEELIETVLFHAIAPLDGAAEVHAHRAQSWQELAKLDRLVTAHKLTPAARLASQACGRQLARLAPSLSADSLAAGFCEQVRARETDGNLAVVEGTLTRALSLTAKEAVLVGLRGAIFSLLSAAVRLGQLSALRSQAMLHRLAPMIESAANEALSLDISEFRAVAPELDIAAMAHPRVDARTFST